MLRCALAVLSTLLISPTTFANDVNKAFAKEVCKRVVDSADPGQKFPMNYKKIKKLIKRGADVNTRYEQENDRAKVSTTPINCATTILDLKLVKLLIKEGADPNQRASVTPGWDSYPLGWAVSLYYDGRKKQSWQFKKGIEIIKALLNAKADPNQMNSKGRAPLHRASTWGECTAIDLLV